jgi:hypothetical protein
MMFVMLSKVYKIKHVPNYFCKRIPVILVYGITALVHIYDGNTGKLSF